MTGNAKEERSEGYEAYFAVMIGLCAALSGFAGFLSADASSHANTAGNDNIMWHAEATTAQTRAYQFIIRDDQLLTQASIEDSIGTATNDTVLHSIANELRNRTYAVKLGFLTYLGTGTMMYSDFEHAWNAFQDYEYQDANDYYQLSQEAAAKEQQNSQKATSYLLSAVTFAFVTVIAAAGLNVYKKSIRRNILYLSIVVLIVSLLYLASIILSLGG